MDPIILGAVAKAGEVSMKVADSAAKETGGLLSRLLGPSADVLGQDWAERLRQKNMSRLLNKTEKHAEGKTDPGWAQPRVANAVFEAAQYANDEIVTDYLSGVLASARAPEGGADDALPWSALVSRLSALQLRAHYVIYLNLRQLLRANDTVTRLYQFPSRAVAFPMSTFLQAVGLDPEGDDFDRMSDALFGLRQEDLIDDFAYGSRDFFTEHDRKERQEFKFLAHRKLETPFEEVLQINFSNFGVQFFLWGLGFGMAHDTDYIDPERDFALHDPDPSLSTEPLQGIGFIDDYWVEIEAEVDRVEDAPSVSSAES